MEGLPIEPRRRVSSNKRMQGGKLEPGEAGGKCRWGRKKNWWHIIVPGGGQCAEGSNFVQKEAS